MAPQAVDRRVEPGRGPVLALGHEPRLVLLLEVVLDEAKGRAPERVGCGVVPHGVLGRVAVYREEDVCDVGDVGRHLRRVALLGRLVGQRERVLDVRLERVDEVELHGAVAAHDARHVELDQELALGVVHDDVLLVLGAHPHVDHRLDVGLALACARDGDDHGVGGLRVDHVGAARPHDLVVGYLPVAVHEVGDRVVALELVAVPVAGVVGDPVRVEPAPVAPVDARRLEERVGELGVEHRLGLDVELVCVLVDGREELGVVGASGVAADDVYRVDALVRERHVGDHRRRFDRRVRSRVGEPVEEALRLLGQRDVLVVVVGVDVLVRVEGVLRLEVLHQPGVEGAACGAGDEEAEQELAQRRQHAVRDDPRVARQREVARLPRQRVAVDERVEDVGQDEERHGHDDADDLPRERRLLLRTLAALELLVLVHVAQAARLLGVARVDDVPVLGLLPRDRAHPGAEAVHGVGVERVPHCSLPLHLPGPAPRGRGTGPWDRSSPSRYAAGRRPATADVASPMAPVATLAMSMPWTTPKSAPRHSAATATMTRMTTQKVPSWRALCFWSS